MPFDIQQFYFLLTLDPHKSDIWLLVAAGIDSLVTFYWTKFIVLCVTVKLFSPSFVTSVRARLAPSSGDTTDKIRA